MTDIPFGEYFTVESRWDVIAAPPAPDGTPCSRVRRCSHIPYWLADLHAGHIGVAQQLEGHKS